MSAVRAHGWPSRDLKITLLKFLGQLRILNNFSKSKKKKQKEFSRRIRIDTKDVYIARWWLYQPHCPEAPPPPDIVLLKKVTVK